jgi:hypothetical protein
VRQIAFAALVALVVALAATPAQATIAFVAKSSNSTSASTTSLTISPVAASSAGDVELATIAELGTGTIAAPDASWHAFLDSAGGSTIRQASYWHISTGGSEPSWTWTFASTQAAGGIADYSGVDNRIIVDAAAGAAGTSGTANTPSVTTGYSGDAVIGVASWDAGGNGGTAAAGTTRRYVDHSSVNGLLEEDPLPTVTGAPPVATASQAITPKSGFSSWIAQAITLKDAGAAGSRSVSSSASPSFAANLNAGDQTQTYTLPLTVTDATQSNAGWNETITSTQFTTGAYTLPASASKITAAPTVSCTSYSNCITPTNSVAYPLTVPAAATPPAAIKFFNAAASTGEGQVTVTPAINVLVPQNSYAGTYASTSTIAIASGP